MTSLWFIVPAHGRLELAEVCLRQLARTCDLMTASGVAATAVVVADDSNLKVARSLGFATVSRNNDQLGRKWNDGYQVAGEEGADFMVPLGSDDWVDARMFTELPLPKANQIRCARRSSIVNETGTRLAHLNITYDGGDGVRVIPAALIEPLRYRPAHEDRKRAIDTSVIHRLRSRDIRPELVYYDLHPLQIVDFKSDGTQLNGYRDCLGFQDGDESDDPCRLLGEHYPEEAIEEMRAVHGRLLVAA